MKRYYVEIETEDPQRGHHSFEAASEKKAIRNAKRLANGKKILSLYFEKDDASFEEVKIGAVLNGLIDELETRKAFRMLWERLYTPGGAYPDVSLCHVHEAMAAILAEEITEVDDLVERWVIASVTILGTTTMLDLALSRDDALGYKQDLDESEAQQELAKQQVEVAVAKLLSEGLLKQEGLEITLSKVECDAN